MLPSVHVVAGILVDTKDRVLIADRAHAKTMSDCWEFPGGKVETGEDAETALRRELHEELGVRIISPSYFDSLQHDYPEIRISIDFFLIDQWHGEVSGREGQALRWICRRDLPDAQLLPADTPVVQALQRLSRC